MLKLTPNDRELGAGFRVRRTLPQVKKRMVGPFVFWDHMGPVKLICGNELQVRAHPHIGLSTITYLTKGEIIHRDSLGNIQPIRPGEVNWMTAGRGIAHSERSTSAGGTELEGIQVWVALPAQDEEVAPNFFHIKEDLLPEITCGEVKFKLIAGQALGATSPVPVYSDMFYLSARVKEKSFINFQVPKGLEGAIYVIEGALKGPEGENDGFMEVYESEQMISYEAQADSLVMIFGGAPLPEKRHMWWNFVSTRKERIEQAKLDWEEGRFGAVVDETEYTPLPKF